MACRFRAFEEYEKKICGWRLIDGAVVCTAINSNRSILFERAENRKPDMCRWMVNFDILRQKIKPYPELADLRSFRGREQTHPHGSALEVF